MARRFSEDCPFWQAAEISKVAKGREIQDLLYYEDGAKEIHQRMRAMGKNSINAIIFMPVFYGPNLKAYSFKLESEYFLFAARPDSSSPLGQ